MLGGYNWKELEGWSCSLLSPGKTASGGVRGGGMRVGVWVPGVGRAAFEVSIRYPSGPVSRTSCR